MRFQEQVTIAIDGSYVMRANVGSMDALTFVLGDACISPSDIARDQYPFPIMFDESDVYVT